MTTLRELQQQIIAEKGEDYLINKLISVSKTLSIKIKQDYKDLGCKLLSNTVKIIQPKKAINVDLLGVTRLNGVVGNGTVGYTKFNGNLWIFFGYKHIAFYDIGYKYKYCSLIELKRESTGWLTTSLFLNFKYYKNNKFTNPIIIKKEIASGL